jgi:hypothetical protein
MIFRSVCMVYDHLLSLYVFLTRRPRKRNLYNGKKHCIISHMHFNTIQYAAALWTKRDFIQVSFILFCFTKKKKIAATTAMLMKTS